MLSPWLPGSLSPCLPVSLAVSLVSLAGSLVLSDTCWIPLIPVVCINYISRKRILQFRHSWYSYKAWLTTTVVPHTITQTKTPSCLPSSGVWLAFGHISPRGDVCLLLILLLLSYTCPCWIYRWHQDDNCHHYVLIRKLSCCIQSVSLSVHNCGTSDAVIAANAPSWAIICCPFIFLYWPWTASLWGSLDTSSGMGWGNINKCSIHWNRVGQTLPPKPHERLQVHNQIWQKCCHFIIVG